MRVSKRGLSECGSDAVLRYADVDDVPYVIHTYICHKGGSSFKGFGHTTEMMEQFDESTTTDHNRIASSLEICGTSKR